MKGSYFRKGDVVIALSDSSHKGSQPRVKGRVYVIHGVRSCIVCGRQTVNLDDNLSIRKMILCPCGDRDINFGKAWTESKHFCKRKHLYSYLQEAVAEQEFELAASIRDIIEQQTLNRIMTLPSN